VNDAEPLFGVDDTVMMGGARSETLARFFRSDALVVLGHLAEGEQEMRRAVAAAQREGSDDAFEGHHQALVLWAIQAGFPDQAMAHARRAVEMAEALGGNFIRMSTQLTLGIALVHAGRFADAVAALHPAVVLMRELRTGLFLAAGALAHLARAELGVGNVDQARHTAEEAIAAARRYGTPIAEIEALRARALVLLASEEPPVAVEDDLRAAEALVARTEAHVYTPFLHEDRAALARRLGDDAACNRELVEAHRLFTAMGATGHAERISRQLSATSGQQRDS
jgi:tetratricopeptide (TPR) repeat protein